MRDNTTLPPSVVVSELGDTIRRRFGSEAAGRRRQDAAGSNDGGPGESGRAEPGQGRSGAINFIMHKLHAFNPAYFRAGSPLFSYSQENFLAGRALTAARVPEQPFFGEILPEPEPGLRKVRLDDILEFFDNPAKFLLTRRLRLYLPAEKSEATDREPFQLDGLVGYQLAQELVGLRLDGFDAADGLRLAKARGLIPHGRAGELLYAEMAVEVGEFLSKYDALSLGRSMPPLEVDLQLDPFRLTGVIDRFDRGIASFRFATAKARDRFRFWIRHLVSSCCAEKADSYLLMRDRAYVMRPVSAARRYLRDLFDEYWKGFSRMPAFFPRSSLAYAEAIHRGKARKAAIRSALQQWAGNEHAEGEYRDRYIALAFRDELSAERVPRLEEFEQTAIRLFGPLLQSEESP
jgi:exodeoxyribonuclease V gamma subunit